MAIANARGAPLFAATTCAAAISAQFIAGKATRDALYLANLDLATLPAMVIATSAFSILLVALASRSLARVSPATLVPLAFAANAALLLVAWWLGSMAPAAGAIVVYLLMSGLGPMLGSGFWLIVTERFDPHTARQHFGQLAASGTLAGLGGALVAERVGALVGIEAMLPLLAAVNLFCAWQVRQLVVPASKHAPVTRRDAPPELAADSPISGLRVLSQASYLRNLAGLVLLGTIAATLADYAFKAQAVTALGRGEDLLRFFAIYYAATSLLAFLVQTTAGTVALERLGLGLTTSTPSAALIVGSTGALVMPGLPGALAARAGESIFRASLFRAAYEIFYTPVPAAEKRAAKSIIDVGFDRLGDAIGGGVLRLLLLLPPARHYAAVLVGSIACSALALLVARRLNRGYVQALERSLLQRAVEFDLSDVTDLTTRTAMLRTLSHTDASRPAPFPAKSDVPAPPPIADPEIQEILALRSRDREQIAAVLREEEGVPGALVPHVIPLLAWDPVAEDAGRALRKVAEEHVGALVDALVDPNQPFAVRRRLARVFSTCVSQRAADGVLWGLEDLRFEVRFQSGRSLAAILEKNFRVRINRKYIFEVVRREVAVGRPVWESQRLLDRVDTEEAAFVDEFLKDRAGQSLAHVFTLLALVLPATPLQIAYRGLHTDDPGLRGTALEYLEGVLPGDIRERLWPFIGGTEKPGGERSREAILDELLKSNDSIMLNLSDLRRRARAKADDVPAGAMGG